MKEYKVPIQSLIDHIKTALDVDPWAKEMAEDLLKEREGYVSVPFSWLVKFCTHIDFVEPLTDAEREVAWRKKLWQQFGIDAPEKVVK